MDAITLMGGTGEVALRLTIATLIGGALGLNRGLHESPAGVRTHALVALGGALLTVTSLQVSFNGVGFDSAAVARVAQGIITGIGFLGGGVILRDDSRRTVHGLTTAASIWIVAGFGIACGAGLWRTALLALGITLTVLVIGGPIERLAQRRFGHPPASALHRRTS